MKGRRKSLSKRQGGQPSSWVAHVDKRLFRATYSWHHDSCTVKVAGAYGRVVWAGRFPFNGRDVFRVYMESKDLLMSMLKKPQWKEKPEERGKAMPADNLAKEYPLFWAFLTEATYQDGTPRQTGTVTLSFEDGALKACLRDREEARILFVSANGLASLLDNVNGAIEEDGADWRPDKFASKKKR